MAYISTKDGLKILDIKVNKNIVNNLHEANRSDIVKLMVLSYLESDHITFDRIISHNPDIINSFLHHEDPITIFHIYDKGINTTPEFIGVLEKYKSNLKYINKVDSIGNNALMVSCINCNIEMIKFLLPLTDDINRSNSISGSTAIHFVMESYNKYGNKIMEIIEMFMKYGADIGKLNSYGRSPLGNYILSNSRSLDIDFIGKMIFIGFPIKMGIYTGSEYNTCEADIICYLLEEGLVNFNSILDRTSKYSSCILSYMVENGCSPHIAAKFISKNKANTTSDKINLISKFCSIIYTSDNEIDDKFENVIMGSYELDLLYKLMLYKVYWLKSDNKPKKNKGG